MLCPSSIDTEVILRVSDLPVKCSFSSVKCLGGGVFSAAVFRSRVLGSNPAGHGIQHMAVQCFIAHHPFIISVCLNPCPAE